MRRRSTSLLLFLTALWAMPATAQTVPRESSVLDLSVGPSWWLEDGLKDLGITGSASFHPGGSVVGMLVDAGYFATGRRVLLGGQPYKEDNRYSLMGGVRVKVERSRVVPFGQFLIGHAPLDGLALQPGAGIDWLVSRRLAVRAATDVKFAGDDGRRYIGYRVSSALVLRLGSRP